MYTIIVTALFAGLQLLIDPSVNLCPPNPYSCFGQNPSPRLEGNELKRVIHSIPVGILLAIISGASLLALRHSLQYNIKRISYALISIVGIAFCIYCGLNFIEMLTGIYPKPDRGI